MSEPVIRITLPAPIETVWTAFRDPAQIRRWHGWEYDGLDAEIRQIFSDGTVASEADRTLHIGGHRFALEDAGAQTIVTVTRAAPLATDDSTDWEAWYDDIDEGWLSFLQQLRFALAHHWGEERSTVYLSGDAVVDPGAMPAELRALADVEPGQRYDTTIAGERLTGEVWFRSAHQLGLTVDRWGPGLLLFAAAPSRPEPYAAAAITLTMYGVADDTRADRWQAWWARSYRPGEPSGDAPPAAD